MEKNRNYQTSFHWMIQILPKIYSMLLEVTAIANRGNGTMVFTEIFYVIQSIQSAGRRNDIK